MKNKFVDFNHAVRYVKSKIDTWRDGDEVGFKIGRKHFTIIRNDKISGLKYK